MSTDAIVLLKQDHTRIKRLFTQIERLSDDATSRRGELVGTVLEELTVHTYLENEVMYPEVRKRLPDLEDDVLESYEEHHVADVLSAELFGMSPGDERYAAKATVLMENVRHHMEEEEQDWFPKVREGLGRKDLSELGRMMEELRPKAPRTPA